MTEIVSYLRKIEKEKNVRVLFACETGSRAWGFPSPDSDYDVRFIYMHQRDWYLSLSERKDTIELMEGDLDITGWDLRKCLQLLRKSNTPLIERFQSPIRYEDRDGFAGKFKALAEAYYSPTAVFYHHYSLVQKTWEELRTKELVKLKSCFYLLRSLLSCNWIVKDPAMLPMHMEGLMTKISPERRDRLRALITLKAGVGEKYLHPKDGELNEWMGELVDVLAASKNNLGVCDRDNGMLDDFFLQMLKYYDNV